MPRCAEEISSDTRSPIQGCMGFEPDWFRSVCEEIAGGDEAATLGSALGAYVEQLPPAKMLPAGSCLQDLAPKVSPGTFAKRSGGRFPKDLVSSRQKILAPFFFFCRATKKDFSSKILAPVFATSCVFLFHGLAFFLVILCIIAPMVLGFHGRRGF